MSVYTSLEHELCCPLCGEAYVHIDRVSVAGRPREDGPFVSLAVDKSGTVIDAAGFVPVGPSVGVGRRHRIALLGWCEMCTGRFALVFTQHKGVTFVESVELPPDVEVPSQRDQEPRPSRTEVEGSPT